VHEPELVTASPCQNEREALTEIDTRSAWPDLEINPKPRQNEREALTEIDTTGA
jgi:hypothetical protein